MEERIKNILDNIRWGCFDGRFFGVDINGAPFHQEITEVNISRYHNYLFKALWCHMLVELITTYLKNVLIILGPRRQMEHFKDIQCIFIWKETFNEHLVSSADSRG